MPTCPMPSVADLEDFRREGHRLIDWIARYLGDPGALPRRVARRGRASCGPPCPRARRAQGEPLAAALADFERQIAARR